MTLRSNSFLLTPALDGLNMDLGDSPRAGDLALLALSVAARDITLEGIHRGVPELTAPGYDSPHVALVEGMAAIAAQVLYRANLLPLTLLMNLLEAVGLPRKTASSSVVDLFVDNPDDEEKTWVAGSLVAAGRVIFEVSRTVIVPAGAQGYGPVPLRCTVRGPQGNVLANNSQWALITAVALGGLANPQPAQGGSLAETDEAFVGRATELFGSRGRGSSVVDLEALTVGVEGMQRSLVLEHAVLQNAARWGQFRWGYAEWNTTQYFEAREGAVTVIARPYGGGYLTSELYGRLAASLEPIKPAGTQIYYASAEEVPVDFVVYAHMSGDRTKSVVDADIRRALAEWCDGGVWPWGGAMRASEATQVVGNVAGLNFRKKYFVEFNADPDETYVPFDPVGERTAWEAYAVDVWGEREWTAGRLTMLTPLHPNFLFRLRNVRVILRDVNEGDLPLFPNFTPNPGGPPPPPAPGTPPDTSPPGVVLTATPGTFTAPGLLTLIAGVSDNNGYISRVELRRDGVLVDTKASGPFEWFIDIGPADSTCVFTATAYDGAGNAGSDEKTVTVNMAAAVSVDSITAGAVSLSLSNFASGDQLDWGDGTTVAAAAALNHTYSASGTRTVRVLRGGQPVASATVTVSVAASPNQLTRSRKRGDYALPNAPVEVTEADLLAGVWGPRNADGWYEVPDVQCHSLTPGVPCIRVLQMSSDLKVKIIRPVVDYLGVPGSNKGGAIVAEGNNSVWVDDGLGFSSPPPIGGNGVACFTGRFVVASNPRELIVTRSEGYGAGGIYVNEVSQGGQFRRIWVSKTAGYNLKGTGYNADGTIRFLPGGGFDISNYIGYKAQFFQIDNAPDASEDNVIVEDWVAHTDPLAMLGRNAGQREDTWNAHASAGVLMRRFLAENGLPWDAAFTGTQTVYGADPASPSGRGVSYSGSDGLGDGYTKNGFNGTPGPNDVPHLIKCEDFTSLNNVNVGAGVTAGNRCSFTRGTAFTAGVIRSGAPGGYSRLAVKPAGDGTGEPGNNACQAYQMYLAASAEQLPERAPLFYGHVMTDLEGSFNWLDNAGNWHQNVSYVDDPNGHNGGEYEDRLYNSFTFIQGGVTLPPHGGGIAVIPMPTSVAEALATLDAKRQARIDAFIAAGTAIGLSDRPVGDVTNYWAGFAV